MVKILCIEDDEQGRFLLKLYFRATSYKAKMVESGKHALDFLEENHVDIILMDWNLPNGLSGTNLLSELSKLKNSTNTSIIIYTADNSLSLSDFENHPNVISIFHKPIIKREFISRLDRLLEEKNSFQHQLLG